MMTHVEIEESVAAPGEDVWDCYLGSRAEELAIGIYAESIVTEGAGVGSVRISKLLGGAGEVRERLDMLDEENLICRYSVIERGPLPFADYKGEITIIREGPTACTIKLKADFTPVGMSEADSVALYMRNNHAGIAKMKKLLGI